MTQTVPKIAHCPEAFRRPMHPYPTARAAIARFLRWAGVQASDRVMLPAYVGWSAREGSGIYDPLHASGATPVFVRVDRGLNVDVDDFARKLESERAKAVFLVHYFGMPDPAFRECARMAREAGAKVLEDEAHAMFSDLVGGVCGREGDAAVFSLHKMLPTGGTGGTLVTNGFELEERTEGIEPFGYDLAAIAAQRRANARAILNRLDEFGDAVTPLWPEIPEGVVPQTLPVLVHRVDRDRLYEEFNGRGYGGVSLYHTMVEPIGADEFPDSHWLARRIFNLPVHQDVPAERIDEMMTCLRELTCRP